MKKQILSLMTLVVLITQSTGTLFAEESQAQSAAPATEVFDNAQLKNHGDPNDNKVLPSWVESVIGEHIPASNQQYKQAWQQFQALLNKFDVQDIATLEGGASYDEVLAFFKDQQGISIKEHQDPDSNAQIILIQYLDDQKNTDNGGAEILLAFHDKRLAIPSISSLQPVNKIKDQKFMTHEEHVAVNETSPKVLDLAKVNNFFADGYGVAKYDGECVQVLTYPAIIDPGAVDTNASIEEQLKHYALNMAFIHNGELIGGQIETYDLLLTNSINQNNFLLLSYLFDNHINPHLHQ